MVTTGCKELATDVVCIQCDCNETGKRKVKKGFFCLSFFSIKSKNGPPQFKQYSSIVVGECKASHSNALFFFFTHKIVGKIRRQHVNYSREPNVSTATLDLPLKSLLIVLPFPLLPIRHLVIQCTTRVLQQERSLNRKCMYAMHRAV